MTVSFPLNLSLSKDTLVSSILFTIIAGYVAQAFWSWYRLRAFRGPLLASFSNLWMVRKAWAGRFHLDLKEACEKYGTSNFTSLNAAELTTVGSLARIGPNTLVTDDPQILHRMYEAKSPYQRGPWYDCLRFDPSKDCLISMRNEAEHSALKSKMGFGV